MRELAALDRYTAAFSPAQELVDAAPFRPSPTLARADDADGTQAAALAVRGEGSTLQAARAAQEVRAAGWAAGWAAGARAAAGAAQAEAARLAAEAAQVAALEADRAAALLAALRTATDAVQAAAVTEARTVLRDVHRGALELATAVLGAELGDASAAARAALARVLDDPHLPEHDVELHLHPRDAAALAEAGLALPEGLTVVPDPHLAPGDARAVHPAGFLDACVSTALDRAREALEALRPGLPGEVGTW